MKYRDAAVAEARTWLGTPYQHQQRTKGLAVDCVGLLIGVGHGLGLTGEGFEFTGYARSADGVTLMRLARLYMVELPLDVTPRPGMVVVIATDLHPHHAGILCDYRGSGIGIIHASDRADPPRVVEHRLVQSMNFRITGLFDFKNVDY